jgi:hypothetical protein
MTDGNVSPIQTSPLEDIYGQAAEQGMVDVGTMFNPEEPIVPRPPTVITDTQSGAGSIQNPAENPAYTAYLDFLRQQELAAAEKKKRDARVTVTKALESYDLQGLAPYLYDLIAKDEVNLQNPDALIASIKDQPLFKERFKGNAARLRDGLPELDPASYIALENAYRDTLRANDLPLKFYDTKDDFVSFIEGDVSPAEIQQRVEQGYAAVRDADPEVRRQMQDLFGVSEGELAAYFIDPERTRPLLTARGLVRQAKAANIAARAVEQGMVNREDIAISGPAFFEGLVDRGITEQQAQAGFTQMGQLSGLYTEMGGEQALTLEQKMGAALGYDIAAQDILVRRQRQRLAEFQGGGQFARTQGAGGTVETGLGEAQ